MFNSFSDRFFKFKQHLSVSRSAHRIVKSLLIWSRWHDEQMRKINNKEQAEKPDRRVVNQIFFFRSVNTYYLNYFKTHASVECWGDLITANEARTGRRTFFSAHCLMSQPQRWKKSRTEQIITAGLILCTLSTFFLRVNLMLNILHAVYDCTR